MTKPTLSSSLSKNHRVGSKYGLPSGGKRGGKRFGSAKPSQGVSFVPIYAIRKLIAQAGGVLTTAEFKLRCRDFSEANAKELVYTSLLFRDCAGRKSKLKPEDVKEAARSLTYPIYV